MLLRYNAPFVSFRCLKVRCFEWYFRIRIQNHIYFENTTNFFYPHYKVSKKESVISEIRGVFPWCFEKDTPEKYPCYKKRPKVVPIGRQKRKQKQKQKLRFCFCLWFLVPIGNKKQGKKWQPVFESLQNSKMEVHFWNPRNGASPCSSPVFLFGNLLLLSDVHEGQIL